MLAWPVGSLRVVEPRIKNVSRHRSFQLGDEAVELYASTGQPLDEHQQLVLRHSLAERNGHWLHPQVGLLEPSQNVKGTVLEGRSLERVFPVPSERRMTHSAHQFDTSMEAFLRMEEAFEESGMSKHLKGKPSRSHGSECFVFKNGS